MAEPLSATLLWQITAVRFESLDFDDARTITMFTKSWIMNALLFEQLDNSGFFRGGKVNADKIANAKIEDILDLAEESVTLTSARELPRESALFSHSASISLGGGRMPCASPVCRLARARELAQFACLYSDRVYIHNFLQDYTSHHGHKRHPKPEWLRKHFSVDLRVLAELRPLIEAGRVTVVGLPDACPTCLIQPKLARIDSRVSSAQRSLLKGTAGEVLTIGGAITVGVVTGLLPSSLAAIASTLGLARILAQINARVWDKSDVEKEARQDEMFFLWKVKRLAPN